MISHCSRSAYLCTRKSADLVDLRSTGVNSGHIRNGFKEFSGIEPVSFRLNPPPRSAPTSVLSSPVLSPRGLRSGDFFPATPAPRGSAIWPRREFPFTDMAAGFSARMSPEKFFASPDHSPLHSPTARSPGVRSRNPSSPQSPLHPMYADSSASWHDGNASANVHPLPLPPGGAVPAQSSFTHQPAPKNEPSSVANQWQKGKLIGSGTFGNVYVATNR